MHRAKIRILSLCLALVFCFLACPLQSIASSSDGYIVRVGMYYDFPGQDNRRFSSLNTCENGFEFGWSDGTGFHRLFSVDSKRIVILPQVNASLEIGSEKGTCKKGEGNIGSYSTLYGTYSGVTSAKSTANRVDGGFVTVTGSGYEVRHKACAYASGSKVCEPKQGGITVVDADTGEILLMYEDLGRPFAIMGKNGSPVTFPMKHRSGSTNYYSYPGFFEYGIDGDKLIMVNCIELETYTRCVMSNEIGTNVSVETRKAFSVLARTVPLEKKHSEYGFDVCNRSCCQVYHGFYRISEENNAIVDSTKGQVITYNSRPIAVLYHNSNGGASCSSVAAWGHEVPYLTSVFLETHEKVEEDKWQYVFTRDELREYLDDCGIELSDNEISIKIEETDPHGSDYITVLSIGDGSGNSYSITTSEDVRKALGFDSANFKVEYVSTVTALTADGIKEVAVSGVLTADGYVPFESFGDSYKTTSGDIITPDSIVIDGSGKGHGVGFSAVGSETLAITGYSYEYILEFFFNGTEVIDINNCK